MFIDLVRFFAKVLNKNFILIKFKHQLGSLFADAI